MRKREREGKEGRKEGRKKEKRREEKRKEGKRRGKGILQDQLRIAIRGMQTG